MSKIILVEAITVNLGDIPFLNGLRQYPFSWAGAPADKEIEVVAVSNSYGGWAAYMETPTSGRQVVSWGDKLPQDVAESLFPEWASSRQWRP